MSNANSRPIRRNLLLFIGGLLVLGLGFWVSQQITWVEEEIDAGLTEAARKDPFYAAKLFLQRQGVETQTLRNLSLLDSLSWQGTTLTKDDTLILLNAHKQLQGNRLNNLLAWVEQGGVVIASTDNPFIGNSTGTSDLLLDHFEITVRNPHYEKNAFELDATDSDAEDYSDYDYVDEDYLDEEDLAEENLTQDNENNNSHKEADGDATISDETVRSNAVDSDETNAEVADLTCKPFASPIETTFPQEPEPLLIDYSLGQSFDHGGEAPTILSSDDNGLQLAFFNLGAGHIVINSDNHIWKNPRIECHDHAYLLWKLINPNGKVWFVINEEAPSLWAILWRSSPYGAVAALLALALWLWAKAARFGPILSRTNSGRRSLAEHIHASAMLLWRRQQHPYLVAQLRAELRQQLLLHYPLFNDWSQQEQITHLQTLTTLTPAELDKALFSTQLLTPQDFTSAVAYLQTIRKSL